MRPPPPRIFARFACRSGAPAPASGGSTRQGAHHHDSAIDPRARVFEAPLLPEQRVVGDRRRDAVAVAFGDRDSRVGFQFLDRARDRLPGVDPDELEELCSWLGVATPAHGSTEHLRLEAKHFRCRALMPGEGLESERRRSRAGGHRKRATLSLSSWRIFRPQSRVAGSGYEASSGKRLANHRPSEGRWRQVRGAAI